MHICGWVFLDFSSHLSTKEKGMGETRGHPVHWSLNIEKKKMTTMTTCEHFPNAASHLAPWKRSQPLQHTKDNSAAAVSPPVPESRGAITASFTVWHFMSKTSPKRKHGSTLPAPNVQPLLQHRPVAGLDSLTDLFLSSLNWPFIPDRFGDGILYSHWCRGFSLIRFMTKKEQIFPSNIICLLKSVHNT